MNFLSSTYPLIQAPMAGAQDSQMAIAVCRAGAIGSLPAALMSAEKLATEIATIQAATDAPFNINFFSHSLTAPDSAAKTRWHQLLSPYFAEYDIDAKSITEGVLRLPFAQAQLEALQQYRPPIVSFHFGLPEKKLLRGVKDTGALVLSTAITLAEALWLQDNGADAIIVQGSEAGGHRGMFLQHNSHSQVGLFALMMQIKAHSKLPLIATGGIADVPSIQAALALGADAVQIGTAYLLCDESRIHPLHRHALEKAAAAPQNAYTALTNLFSGRPARGLVNRLMRENGFIHADAMPFPYAGTEINALRTAAEAENKDDFTPLWCGQNPQGCSAESAESLTRQWCRQVWKNNGI